MRENFLTSDLSISGNFEQLWCFCGRKAPSPHPPPGWGKHFFNFRSIHFRQFQATLVFVAEKPSLHQDEAKFFDFRSIHFRQIWATLVFVAEKPPPLPPRMRQHFFWLQIYPFQSISSNFGFCGRKAPPYTRMSENFLTSDLSISGNFEKLWFLWQKSPASPPGWGKIFWLRIYTFQAILSNFGFCGRKAPPSPQDEAKFFDFRSIHFRQFWATLVFVAEKSPTPFPPVRENFLTSDLSISGNFKQLWFLWQKSTLHQDEGKFFWLQIYPFQAISSNFGFCDRKVPATPQPGWGKIFWLQIYPFQAILSNFGFCGRIAPLLPKDEARFFDFRSIHFRQLWATLVFVVEKPSPRMAKFFDFRSIHFRQFWATLVFLWQKSPLPWWGKIFWL